MEQPWFHLSRKNESIAWSSSSRCNIGFGVCVSLNRKPILTTHLYGDISFTRKRVWEILLWISRTLPISLMFIRDVAKKAYDQIEGVHYMESIMAWVHTSTSGNFPSVNLWSCKLWMHFSLSPMTPVMCYGHYYLNSIGCWYLLSMAAFMHPTVRVCKDLGHPCTVQISCWTGRNLNC